MVTDIIPILNLVSLMASIKSYFIPIFVTGFFIKDGERFSTCLSGYY